MEGHQRPGEALWVKLSWREEDRANDWIGARAVEPTCPTTGAGWGSGGGRGGAGSLPCSLVGAPLRPTGGGSPPKEGGSVNGCSAPPRRPARAPRYPRSPSKQR